MHNLNETGLMVERKEGILMNLQQSFSVVDAHTTGSPVRLVTTGIPLLEGETINEKMEYMKEHFDHLRTCIVHQPRGYQSLMCAVLVPPCKEEADFGLFYMDAQNYQPMCGAGTLAVAKALIEVGMVERKEPIINICFDTGSGLVSVDAEVRNGEVKNISLNNVPAFLYKKDVKLVVEGLGELVFDIGFGGNFFVILDTKQLPLSLKMDTLPQYKQYMKAIIKASDEQLKVVHPLNPALTDLNQVLFYRDTPDENGGYTCQCIFGDEQVDISPCGTGTSARLAQMYARGRIAKEGQFLQNSIFGGTFKATIVDECSIGDTTGILPRVSCDDVRVTGFNHLVVEKDDIHKNGLISW